MTEAKPPAQAMIELLEKNNELLQAILEQLLSATTSMTGSQPAPDYRADIKEFQGFDWDSIGAKIVQIDEDGVATVSWRDKLFLRRSAQNKFGPAIWFSRSTGKDEDGENTYERLITFKEMPVADPLPGKTKAAMRD